MIPILYLKGISTGDFEEALGALLGKDAGGQSASTIARLKEAWVDEHARWRDPCCPSNGMSTSGPMASTSRPGSKMTRSACS